MGLVGGGAMAEYVVVHQDEAMPMPAGVGWAEAAAIPESFLTAYDALVVRGRLRSGERVLLHAVGSGLGTAAAQIARHRGATVIGTSRTPDKLVRALVYGVDHGIDTSAEGPHHGGFREAVLTASEGHGVDVILDVLGGPALDDNLAVLAPRGRLVLLGFLGGSRAEADLGPVLRKRLEIVGTVMRTRGLEERVSLARAFEGECLPLFESGQLHAVVGATFPMDELARAQAAMEENATFGKVVVEW